MTISAPNERDPWEEEMPRARPLWWLVLWAVWSISVALIVYAFDRSVLASATWLAAGACVALFGYSVIRWFAISAVDFYAQQDNLDDRLRIELLRNGQSESLEYRGLLARASEDAIPVAMLVGVFHGALVGSLGGAIAKYDAYFAFSSSTLACCGTIIGMACLPCWYALLLVMALPRDKSESYWHTVRRRIGLAVTPVFALATIAGLMQKKPSPKT